MPLTLRRTRLIAACVALGFAGSLWLVQIGPRVLAGPQSYPTKQAFADTTRSLGLSALLILAASLPLGLLVGRGIVHGRRAAIASTAHRTLSSAGLVVVGLHLLTLLGASSLGPSVARLLVPFLWPYRTLATGFGVVSILLLFLLGPSYYLRARIGARRWRVAHRLIPIGLAFAVAHSLGGG